MCTALSFKTNNSYFGRNLDLEYSYNETVTVTPRNYPFKFRKVNSINQHFALIGMAYVVNDYPLYYDAVNEYGLSMAGLNFPENAVYYPQKKNKDNITPFEFIPWVLSQCKTVEQTKALLEKINLLNEPFSSELPLSALHWIISDKEKSITVESVEDGMKIYDNEFGVLTNNPPFDFMKYNLSNYRDLSACQSENRFNQKLFLPVYCQGMGAIGLPGDYSSASRFVKATFLKFNSICGDGENESVSQFFHILNSVEMPRGSVRLENGKNDITVYSSCCNQDTGVYYYTTYDNRQITAVDMKAENLNSESLISYNLLKEQNIYQQNK